MGMCPKIIKSRTKYKERDWPRYAQALDMYLAGKTLDKIAEELGITRQAVSYRVKIAKAQLAFRVFYIKRPSLK